MQIFANDVALRYRHPGASDDLVIPVHMVCNTPDEVLIRNITENSRLDKEWLQASDPHNGIAVICGSGPSIADTLEEVRSWRGKATIFALNGCARFLAENGTLADYQVMCDARPENVELIGPARQRLFASQCDPIMFRMDPDAILWHLQIGEIEDYFPAYENPYVLIGGAASVGNTAGCLAYAMGFREIHFYGMDSSHRDGQGHAFRQRLNDGDPTCIVEWGGKTYLASLTMRHQAEKFMETAKALEEGGASVFVHGSGLLPDIWNAPKMDEAEKYRAMWGHDIYRQRSPGQEVAHVFLEHAKPKPTDLVADLGCGTGRGGLEIAKHCNVVLVDFAENSRDEAAQRLPFVKADLSKHVPVKADFAYCCDVLEHIPPEKVDWVLYNVFDVAPKAFLQISLVDDALGFLIGQRLHLSVHPFEWWRDKLQGFGRMLYWSDLGDTAIFFVERDFTT